ncbi:hypothetical protein Tco_0379220, partial [Tanacetum coccineum]
LIHQDSIDTGTGAQQVRITPNPDLIKDRPTFVSTVSLKTIAGNSVSTDPSGAKNLMGHRVGSEPGHMKFRADMDMAYRTSWIRRIGPIGYGVSDLLGTAYWATPVWCIGSLGTAYWLFGYGVLYILGTAYRALGVDVVVKMCFS